MISSLSIENFKSLKRLKIGLTNLNIITGINGVGKSSLIQALLLLRQSAQKHQLLKGISLDGPLTGNLGSAYDIVNRESTSQIIKIELDALTFSYNAKDRLDETFIPGQCNFSKQQVLPLFSENKFQYVAASRISPESHFTKDTYSVENKQFGKSGEYAISYIAEVGNKNSRNKKFEKYKPLITLEFGEDNKALPLENQINYWLKYIADNVRLNILKPSSTKYDLHFEFYNGKSWDSYSAANSAFGLTYALPVITALVAAAPGDLIILENPESDLHPQAQSKLGELIARSAQAGVQLIIETHSDHLLNGIRLGISRKPPLLVSSLAKVFYFYRPQGQSSTLVEEVHIDQSGRMPIKDLQLKGIYGFFDQLDKDYKQIISNQFE